MIFGVLSPLLLWVHFVSSLTPSPAIKKLKLEFCLTLLCDEKFARAKKIIKILLLGEKFYRAT